ncbi:probable E3 ubiquitin ligase complex SCF subunit sconB [Gastrolobium bilobum]|uniref:probable E3 ubiquitin ligase complex SCF subunit sconB n=1 Tax=Gastrolobium bilobum TaxID=150636 RepID=UPI002AB31E44|nr:probable E3 ubiquitin ligase complex SCF subunit sconB [Gastrolobium bilobum]
MEKLPLEICMRIFCFLDYHNLAVAQQVCRKWKLMASEDALWSNLFKERWGGDHAAFYSPIGSKLWKDVYEVEDRCDRVGVGLKIIREGSDYYLVQLGEKQRYLGSRKNGEQVSGNSSHTLSSERGFTEEGSLAEERSCRGILDKILFFIGDLEVASADAKRSRVI